jgi:uncharacterized membrane protein
MKNIIGPILSILLFSCSYEKIEPPAANNSEDELIIEDITYTNDVKPILDQHCISCHSPSGSQSWLDVSTYSGAKAQVTNGGIQSRVINESPSPMPPSGGISQEEKNIIQTWIDQGTIE